MRNVFTDLQFDIEAAPGDHSAVTSVVFWDGPELVFGDYIFPVFGNDSSYSSGSEGTMVMSHLPDDTYVADNITNVDSTRNGFGFQIHPSKTSGHF